LANGPRHLEQQQSASSHVDTVVGHSTGRKPAKTYQMTVSRQR
jgi:hypothetical protein